MKRFLLGLMVQVVSVSLWAQWPFFENVSTSKGIEDIPKISFLYGNGAAIADYDKDGDLDFFLCTAAGVADRLYVNNGTGFFFNNASFIGLNSTDRTRVALWFDYDADEDLDLVTLGDCYAQGCNDPITIKLYKQQNNGIFTETSESAGLNFGEKYVTNFSIAGGGLAAGDLNNDGYLDLIVSVWGGPLSYFENSGNGSFVDKSADVQMGNNFRYRWQPMIYDFNQDGYQDVYVNVDFAANELWINNGDGTFTNKAAETFSDSAFNEMGLTLGDYDNDGDMDLYATNISRVDSGVLRHNILLKNLKSSTGLLLFDEVANDLQVGASGWDWGTAFADLNNDGRLDLVTTNGWTPTEWGADTSRLWLNLGDGLFGDISISASFNDAYDATSLMAFDMDRDGDLDLLQTLKDNSNTNAPLVLYENNLNETPNPGNYIVIKPRGAGANYFGIGSVVKITTDNTTQIRLISAGTSLYGQEPAEAFFGIGEASIISELKVIWPDQTETVLNDVAINQEITVLKNQNLGITESKELNIQHFPNPVKNVLHIKINSTESSLEVVNMLGQVIDRYELGFGTNSIDVSNYSTGIYTVKIFNQSIQGLSSFLIVKE